MILPDHELRRLVHQENLVTAMPDGEQFQPASLDLTLGEEYYNTQNNEEQIADDEITIKPLKDGYFYLCHTQEEINIPYEYLGFLQGRSSIGRKGVIIHATAGIMDPGFRGQATLEVANLSPEPVTLPVGSRVCQLMLSRLTESPERPYDHRDSKYMGQTGVQQSKLEEDFD